jgi:hypothetical protein
VPFHPTTCQRRLAYFTPCSGSLWTFADDCLPRQREKGVSKGGGGGSSQYQQVLKRLPASTESRPLFWHGSHVYITQELWQAPSPPGTCRSSCFLCCYLSIYTRVHVCATRFPLSLSLSLPPIPFPTMLFSNCQQKMENNKTVTSGSRKTRKHSTRFIFTLSGEWHFRVSWSWTSRASWRVRGARRF